MKKETMNFKENGEKGIGGFGGRRVKGEYCNYIIMSKVKQTKESY